MLTPKLLIADDHILFNEGVRQLLSEKYEVVGQVYDGKDVLSAIHLKKTDVILLDINLPSINGFDLAKEIKRAFDTVKIIFLSMYTEPRFIEQSKFLEVNGYLLKNSTKEELIEGIESVLRGETYYDTKLQFTKISLHHNDFFVKQYSLTPREIEIVRMIKDGMSTSQIAEKLFLGQETVKTHRKNIYYKLSITKSTELIKFAIENNI
ncbi:response regulator transcription factor [Emticicia sp. BO119]|uniref:response regulator n=1 Tax=Emticicia sp. BO119 TaxID=2757768 RepID=UPI0015F052FF|nr:response regulator transcription factor [Emticicia sp. BO119]MBA4850559.1 response regulator transcription factor [Emticicia sp. BO119]